ncbi:hypothetical protein SBF1_4920008 [Candidatus Desulfosporosinus infrequens]|uniref:Uncharacterized protein n=1 Tax=Candidatus Desulfosporosinus infrequens TaxID=2043169 RepID=A0A2U3LGL2_9FIRM|nr:hypothetical protein SBF1_4920008 [Candidatus Desulfosporosinus infrequens]
MMKAQMNFNRGYFDEFKDQDYRYYWKPTSEILQPGCSTRSS